MNFLFFYCIGEYIKYSIKTIENIIIAGFKRHWTTKMEERYIPKDMANRFYLVLKEMKSNVRLKRRSEGMEPILYYDLELVIKHFPMDVETREEEKSLYLFSLYMGARCITYDHILIGLIQYWLHTFRSFF